MKKSELKNIIKECVKEVIFEEGVLSGIISEVAQGLGRSQVEPPVNAPTISERKTRSTVRQQVLGAIGSDAYSDLKNKFDSPELFEGTRPIPSGDGKGALSGVDPHDPGVDLNNIPGISSWAKVAQGNKR
jgi:hypothetical protein